MALEHLLKRWQTDASIAKNIAAWQILPARQADWVNFPASLHPQLAESLKKRGIQALYSHQLSAWEAVQAGKNVVIATGTASGKTLAYNLPVVDLLYQSPAARALYLFPTKALAQDQLDELMQLVKDLNKTLSAPIIPGVYDGDTPASARPKIRQQARILLTNPDMLHTGILPHHTNWTEFFKNLRFIVVDEVHVYRGVFGSHVANVIRRLKRITHFYGAQLRFILASATIANPGELAEKLIEEPFEVIQQDGSQRGVKHFLLYNPPIVNEELGIRRSLLQETVRLSEDLLSAQVQTVIFGRTRRSIELALSYLRQQATSQPSGLRSSPQNSIRGYRSGYLPTQRREIEAGLRDGSVQMVVATNALELGIDIGQMEAALLAGYPGTIASTWQQAGRAGRSNKPALAALIVSANPLDQYLARFPDYFFSRPIEQALINPDNLIILLGHLRCAAFELPFREGENFGSIEPTMVQELLDFLTQEGALFRSGEKYYWMSESYPAQAISLRSASPDSVVLQKVENGFSQIVGQVDLASAAWMVHPGAIYLHEGQTYQVVSLDLDRRIAQLQEMNSDYYTEPSQTTSVHRIETLAESTVMGGQKAYGEIKVIRQVVGYRKLRWYTAENLGYGEVQLPPYELNTTGYWIRIANATIESLARQGLWSNAPNDYGPLWNQQRALARARDGYRCQICGMPEGVREHDVHHIKPFRTFSDPVEAHQLSNLITLCPSCHHKAETAVRMRSGLAGMAFVMANLAPLFVMCDPRDLGVHADGQALFANPEGDENCGLILFDQAPAGIGLSARLYELHEALLLRAYELVSTCPCPDGCPSCVGPGGEQGTGGKAETLALLKALTA